MPRRPNVLFLLSDEHSFRAFSHLDPTGEGEPAHTPNFDALVARSTSFHQSYCQVPLCTPSRICMLTGRNPMGGGGWINGSMVRDGIKTLPQRFAEAGYETCLIGKMHLGGDKQFVGFRQRPYGDLTGGTGHQWEPLSRFGGRGMRERTRDAGITEIPESALQERIVSEETLAFLREHRAARPDQPWLLCASFSRPHFPLTAPPRHWNRYWPDNVTEPKIRRAGDTANHPMTVGMAGGFRTEEIEHEEMMRARAGYFACVTWLDEIIGDLLAGLERAGLLQNTIIVYTTDHGELMGEHGMWWKNSWHEGCMRVPLLFQLPEQRCGELEDFHWQTPVSLADLYPTLCGLCGVERPDGLEGTDLSIAVRGGGEPDRGPVFAVNPHPRWGEGCEHVIVREGRFKYVAFRGVQDLLFDLEADPHEMHNLATDDDFRETARRMRSLAESWWDFDAAESQMQKDQSLAKSRTPEKPKGPWGNLYCMPGGAIVDAESPLYRPHVLTENPSDFFKDWPGR